MKRSLFAVLALATLVVPATSAAQLPEATDEQRAAGARVATIQFGTEQVVVRRGETITLQTVLLDADGNVVEGAVAVLLAQAGVSPTLITVGGPNVELTGTQPGEGVIMAMVMVPEGSSATRGPFPGSKPIGTVPVMVADFPAASIEITAPAYAAYTGTSLQVGGQVMTDQGTEHSTATIAWRSSNPSVASITAGGIITVFTQGSVTLTASTENGVSGTYRLNAMENPVTEVSMTPSTATTQTGDVVEFDIVARDANGRAVTDVALDLAVSGLGAGAGFVYQDGTFVAEEPGAYRVIASAGGTGTAAVVEVHPREAAPPVEFLSHGARADVATSDLWAFEGLDGRDYVYTGTHSRGGGQKMFVWDVTDPTAVELIDSVMVDARVVNDVKVSDDASWAIITRENASTRRNGIVVLDLADPAHPTIMSELTDSLTGGIHNVWIVGDLVYAVNNGTNAMHILDLSDPANPTHAGRFEIRPGETGKSLHDVWAEDGYAYLSYWDDGLVIVDIGAGTHGGTPTEPVFVSSISYPAGNTHVAWRDRDYVFIGDEIGTADGMRGYIHVIDVSDIDNPREVAKYDLPEAGAHNVWVEDETLYVAYYQGGVRIIDVSGTLRGDLYRQGREIGLFRTGAGVGNATSPNSPMAWGPQVFKGNVFVSDMNSGLWVIKHEKPRRITF